mgnify:CR=1 FL=1|jgi:hypothetical protein
MKSRLCAIVAMGLFAACGNSQQTQINEVQFGITSSAVVGRISALAMDAIKGGATACATVKTACATYPCATGEVTVTLGAGCPLPLGGTASGTVSVTGNFTSADNATLSHTYVNTQVTAQENKALALASVAQVKVTRSGNLVTVNYSGADAKAGATGGAVAVGAGSSWTVAVDTKNTPDPSDDVLTVDASSASAGGFSGVRASTISKAVLDPSCRSNPISGSANITEVSGGIIPIPSIIKIKFLPGCDGQAEVNGTVQPFQLLP